MATPSKGVGRGYGSGGYRLGGGRPKGSKTRHIKRVSLSLAKARITPLEYALGILNSAESSAEDKRWACIAAMPYCHPRLAPKLVIERRVLDPDELTDEELLAAVRDLEQRLASGVDDEDEDEPEQRQATAPPQSNGHDPDTGEVIRYQRYDRVGKKHVDA